MEDTRLCVFCCDPDSTVRRYEAKLKEPSDSISSGRFGAEICKQEVHCEFEHFAKWVLRFAFLREPFGQRELFLFQLGNARFIGLHDAIAGSIYDAVQKLRDLSLAPRDRTLDSLRHDLPILALLLPGIFEHRLYHLEDRFAGPHALQQRFELTFDLGFADRLALGRTALRVAVIVRVVLSGF